MTTLIAHEKTLAPEPKQSRRASDAERKRISREYELAKGIKQFCLKVGGMHLQYVEAIAFAEPDLSAGQVLREIIEAALDRHVGVQNRAEQMCKTGATDEDIENFISTHLNPPLPA